MPRHVSDSRDLVSPRSRSGIDVAFLYAGEAAQLLDIADLDYRQIRTLYVFVRDQRGLATPAGSWARFSPVDLICLTRLITLVGGKEQLAPNKRLRLHAVRQTTRWLRSRGVANPLLEVPMTRVGSRVLIQLSETDLDPLTGQEAFTFIEGSLKNEFRHDQERMTALLAELTVQRQQTADRDSRLSGALLAAVVTPEVPQAPGSIATL